MNGFFEKHRFTLFFGAFGGIFLLVGLIFVGVGIISQQAAGRLEEIPVLDLAHLSQAAAGTEVALEGKVSERNPFQFRPFVAYIRQEYQGQRCNDNNNDNRGPDCRAVWVEDERVTPPLWLDLPGGRARLANTDYDIQYPPFTQQSTPGLVERETKSYQGFRISDPVFTVGQVVHEAEGPALKATLVAGGNRASYLANVRGEAGIFTWLGGTLSLLGGIIIVVPITLRLRGRR